MRVIAPMPTRPMFSCLMYSINCSSLRGLALPSISSTSCSGGVSAFSKNIHRCGMKLRVTPLSGLYRRMFILFFLRGSGAPSGFLDLVGEVPLVAFGIGGAVAAVAPERGFEGFLGAGGRAFFARVLFFGIR